MKLRAARWGGAFLIVALLGFASGLFVDQTFPASPYLPDFAHRSVGNVNLTELQQAIQVIQANYVDGNLDATKLSHATVQGLVASLGDPFSQYYDPAQYKRLTDSL
jgi:C-terminal processing protease CtpA/Prc